jgi:hypothetical protein
MIVASAASGVTSATLLMVLPLLLLLLLSLPLMLDAAVRVPGGSLYCSLVPAGLEGPVCEMQEGQTKPSNIT